MMHLPFLLAALLQGSPATIETVARDTMSRIEVPRRAVARSPKEWVTLWRQHAGDAPAPAVDLEKRTVIAVFLGTRPSAGFAVEITGTKVDGDEFVVQWSERVPPPGTMVAQVLTAPFHIVTVPKLTGVIRFEKAGQ